MERTDLKKKVMWSSTLLLTLITVITVFAHHPRLQSCEMTE